MRIEFQCQPVKSETILQYGQLIGALHEAFNLQPMDYKLFYSTHYTFQVQTFANSPYFLTAEKFPKILDHIVVIVFRNVS